MRSDYGRWFLAFLALLLIIVACDYWSYGDGGFTFKDLTPGILMTLRASAPGFVTKDISSVGPGQWDIVIELERSEQ